MRTSKAPPSPSAKAFSSLKFDFLVVGGGTAGLVVATRLAETPGIIVGVLEAGPHAFDEPLINIPGRFGESLGTKYDWKFETTPQEGINGRSLPWPRGKVLGGTSALNFMTWNRGCREDYDAWKALGNEGWGWDDLLPYFKKSEHFLPPAQADLEITHYNVDNHGTTGPIFSVYSNEFAASHQFWHSTLSNLDIETNRNHFGGSNIGAWTTLTSVDPKTRTRCYSATGYYQPAMSRPNLSILTEAMVEEIVLEQVDGQWVATRVRFTHSGEEYYASASEEIIICAGSVQSPQLLELSGVGNPATLQAAGIEVKIANPNVGENLQEHMMTMAIYEISSDITTADDIRLSPERLASAMEEFGNTASGPLTQIPSSIAYLPFKQVLSPPAMDSILARLSLHDGGDTSQASAKDQILRRRFDAATRLGQIEFNFDTSNYSPHFVAEPGKKYATMMMMLQYPFSMGSVHIPASKTMSTVHQKPLIDPKYYQGAGGEIDFLTMVESQKFADKITRTSPLSSVIVKRAFPPSTDGEDEDFTEFVRNYTITDWHPVGTCSMGSSPLGNHPGYSSTELGGVVDSRLRVHGVKGLRVIDASIMPLQISAHIQATVYAIGEKGASLILEDYETQTRAI